MHDDRKLLPSHNSATAEEVIRLQAERHFSVPTGEYQTVEEFCLSLIHLRAYHEAAKYGLNRRVLDLGCNNGYGTQSLAVAGASLAVGVDVSRRLLDEAGQRFIHPKVRFLAIDGMRLPFSESVFDLVTSFQVIEHVADYQSYLSEIVRVTRTGGVALFTTPNAHIRLDQGMKPWNMFHVREFRHDELHALLAPWFSSVQVVGSFATPELYAIERSRVNAMLAQARRDQQRKLPPMWLVRKQAIEAVKAMLPGKVVDDIRHRVRRRHGARHNPSSVESAKRVLELPAFTMSDLFYKEDNCLEALELMAICRC